MNEIYKSYEELPLMLSGIAVGCDTWNLTAGAYALVKQDGFPSLSIGSRIVIPKDKLILWVDRNCA